MIHSISFGNRDRRFMKQESDKTRKQVKPASSKTVKSFCGTLSYMAECRGVTQRDGSIRWAAPPGSIDKSIRK